jgi:hypothetical protein
MGDARTEHLMHQDEILASNLQHLSEEPRATAWDDPDALVDIAFVAGLLGLIAGLLAVSRWSGTHFPDTLFWRALPLLIVLPPAFFMGVLMAPGGVLQGGSSPWSRAAWLGMSGLASYFVPIALLSCVAALACLR